ncbi:hypothetical protein SPWS13_1421 [Shewanella putrefaciens]|nr:hypothetical protein SPWS13_1421 [Shewanella putrefaciens]
MELAMQTLTIDVGGSKALFELQLAGIQNNIKSPQVKALKLKS